MISVIIPVYNTEKYLEQCINSVLNQSYKNFEVILVNDASPDNSLSICVKYQKKDKRVVLINKTHNEGVDKARFSGIKASVGNYITFLDSDDWLGHDTLEKFHLKSIETNADIIQIGIVRVMDKYGFIKKRQGGTIREQLITQPELFDKYYVSFFGVNILEVNIWGKLYKKSFVLEAAIRPSGYRMGEDLVFNMLLFPYVKSFYIINDDGYYYRFGGMTSCYNPYILKDLKSQYSLKKEMIYKYSYEKVTKYTIIELKNVLRTHIKQMIYYKTNTKENIIANIKNELKDVIYDDISILQTECINDPFVISLINKDAENIYFILRKQIKEDYLKTKIKRLISYILTAI